MTRSQPLSQRPWRRLHILLGLALLAPALGAPHAGAQSSEAVDKFWVTDGSVAALAQDPTKVYLGGTFTQVAPRSGSSVRIDAASGFAPAPFPEVHGSVFALLPDGAGGWFVGGAFDKVGGVPRSNLAHILSDGRLSRWAAFANGPVYALAREPGWLYVGGAFGMVGSTPRNNLARVDTAFGSSDPTWDPDVTGPGAEVRALTLLDAVLYAGGTFTTVNAGLSRNNVAAFDTPSGLATAWDPNTDGPVHALTLEGPDVILGGAFGMVGGVGHNRLARVDSAGGTLQAFWNPNPDGDVFALAAFGGTVYAGGAFANAGGFAHPHIVAIDPSGLAVAGFDPGCDGDVRALAVSASGSDIYVGGDFSVFGGQPRHHLADVDATGALLAWDPHAFGSVLALAFDGRPSGPDWVYAGGIFSAVNGAPRRNLAAFLKASGAVDGAFTPEPNLPVHVLRVAGGSVYAGGEFTSIGGAGRNSLAQVDAATGAAMPWNPDVTAGASTPIVRTLDIDSGAGLVYAGGDFTTVNSVLPRQNAAAFSQATGIANAWDPGPNATVRALQAVPAALRVHLAGDFTLPQPFFVSVNNSTGAPLAFAPNLDGSVFGFALAPTDVYMGGSFSMLGAPAQSRSRAGAVSPSGMATAWDPNVGGARVGALVQDSANTIMLGGDFNDVGGTTRHNLAQVDLLAPGALSPWDPDANGGPVQTILPTPPMVFVGGDFLNVSRRPQRSFAAFCKAPVPFGVTATPIGPNSIQVNWTDVGTPSYNVYRSSDAGSPYVFVGSGASGAVGLVDFAAEGGLNYSYVVRAEQSDCESDPSGSASASTSGPCGVAPLFDGAADAIPGATPTCTATVLWNNALGQCGESPVFSVYRDTNPDFVPSAATRFAQGLSSLGWTDVAELLPGQTYYYVVRALDLGNGEEDQNLVHVPATLPAGCTAAPPPPTPAITARTRDSENRVEWVFPPGSGQIELRYDDSPGPNTPCVSPATSADGTAVPGSPFVGVPAATGGVDHLVGAGLNDHNFCYSAFVQGGGGESAAAATSARPAALPAAVTWAYTTGASALSRPAVMPLRAYLGVSNDRLLHAMSPGPGGGTWPTAPTQWQPQAMNAVALGRPTIVELPTTTVGGASRIALVGAQDGRVYCFDAESGATLWVANGGVPLGDGLVAPPSVMVTDFGTTPANLVFVATRNSTSPNRLYALQLATGNVAWQYDNGAGLGTAIGIISGQPLVEYGPAARVYFASRRALDGSSDSVWALDVDAGLATKAWSGDHGDIDGAITRRGAVLYVGNNNGDVSALAHGGGGLLWSLNFPGGPIKGFVWPDAGSTRLYFSVGNEIHALTDNGASAAPFWAGPLTAIPSPSTPILNGSTMYVGGGDGQLYSAVTNVAGPPPLPTSVMLGDPTVPKVLGAPTFDRGNPSTPADDIVVVGSDEGRFYAVHPPF